MITVRIRGSRRRFLTFLASSALGGLAACSGDQPPIGARGVEPSDARGAATPTPMKLLGVIPLPPAATATPTPVPVVLRFGHWETGPAGRALADISEWFSRGTPGARVRPEVASFGRHFQSLQQSLASGAPPDVFVTSGAFFDDQRKSSVLADVGKRVTSDAVNLQRYWSEPIVRPTDGHLYALPLWGAVDLVLLNLDSLDAAAVAPPGEGWTWNDLLNAARKATLGKPGEVSRWGTMIVNEIQGGWGSFVVTNGGRWLDPGGKTSFDQAATRALRWVADLILIHHVAPTPTDQQLLTRGGTLDPFIGGNVAILPTGSWEIPSALNRARFRWDVIAVPRATESTPGISIGSVQPGSLAQSGKHLDLAWQFLKYLLGHDPQEHLAAGKVRLPALRDVAQDSSTGYATPPPIHAMTVISAMSTARDLQFTANWQAWRAGVISALDRSFDGRASLDEGVATAVLAGNAALERSTSTP
jgi:multiple sugar transport system substrate-binding protein